MTKWLRKYNSFILVIGGVLLMVAWLLPETIRRFGQQPFGAAPLRVEGSKVSYETFQAADREFRALNRLLPMNIAQIMGVGDSPEHWLLLTREAEKGGFLTGKNDGPEFLGQLARIIARQQYTPPDKLDEESRKITDLLMQSYLPRVMEDTRMNEDEVMRALGRLHGVNRMRSLYMSAPRLSDRRLAGEIKQTDDAATADYVFIPPEREIASVPDPDAATLQAHFEKFKAVKPGEGDYGIGYLLPDRIKVAYIAVDRAEVQAAVSPDPVEVRKRFVKAYPTGQLPAGQDEKTVMAGLENAVRTEQADRVMKSAEVAIKSEFEKATRKLESDTGAGGSQYKKLPADWARPDFERVREAVIKRVKDATGTTLPNIDVEIRAAEWLTAEDLGKLAGIGSSFIRSGNSQAYFTDTALRVRELAGPNESGIQVGVPVMEPLTDIGGGRYFYMVLDAKKESAPESVEEIRTKATEDFKKIAAFEKLKEKQAAFREVAVASGLEPLAAAGADGKGASSVKTAVRIDGNGVGSGDPQVNTPEFRKAVLAAAGKLDPLSDISKADAADRTVVVPVAQSLGIAVAKVITVSPLTIEHFRTQQGQAIQRVTRAQIDGTDDPYSLDRLEERLKIEYLDGRFKENREKAEEAKKDQKAAPKKVPKRTLQRAGM